MQKLRPRHVVHRPRLIYIHLEQIRQRPLTIQGSQVAHTQEQHHPHTRNRHTLNKVGVEFTAQVALKRQLKDMLGPYLPWHTKSQRSISQDHIRPPQSTSIRSTGCFIANFQNAEPVRVASVSSKMRPEESRNPEVYAVEFEEEVLRGRNASGRNIVEAMNDCGRTNTVYRIR